MLRIAGFAVLVIGYCSLSSGCCCCADFMKGFNKGFNQGFQAAQRAAEEERRFQEQQQRMLEEQAKQKQAEQTIFDYNLRTGQFILNGQPLGVGFSGTGKARNNPDLFAQLKSGPIPVGDWRVSNRTEDAKTGEAILELKLFTGGHVKGRVPDGETFTIHAETRPAAGESGIAAPRTVRDQLQVGNLIRVR